MYLDYNQDYNELDVIDPKQQSFRNLYWSGIVSIQTWNPGEAERSLIGPALKVEKELYDDLEVDADDGWELLFNPIEFNNEHKPLLLENYKLSKEELHKYAAQLTQIRR